MVTTFADVIGRGEPIRLSHALVLFGALAEAVIEARARGERVARLIPRELAAIVEDGDDVFGLERVELRRLPEGEREKLDPEEVAPYVAPEIEDGDEETEAAAVYTLAAVTYALLAGAPPRRGRSADAIAVRKRIERVPPLAGSAGRGRPGARCPEAVDAALRRALGADPAARPQSIAALRRALAFDAEESFVSAPTVRPEEDTVIVERGAGRDAAPPAANYEQPLIGPYRCLNLLGVGGMGAVYKAEHVDLQRITALKVLTHIAQHPSAPERFRREAQLASRIIHPNAAIIYDFAVFERSLFYIAMEYVDGKTLAWMIAPVEGRANPLPIARALRIAAQIAEVLEVAHAAGIIHRDLKPANVLVARRTAVTGGGPAAGAVSDEDLAKVVDFGIACSVSPAADAPGTGTSGSVTGTPDYMAPEQALGAPDLDPRADIFSFGILLYEMLTGTHPYYRPGEALVEKLTRRACLDAPPPRLSDANPNIPYPRGFDEAVRHALAPRREDRARSAREVVAALERAFAASRAAQH